MIPPIAGIHHLVAALDDIVSRRPRTGRLPTVLLTGGPAPDDKEKAIRGYGERLVAKQSGTRMGLVPYAVVTDADAPTEDTDRLGYIPLLECIATDLESSMPRAAGRLRLPQFYTCLTVFRSQATGHAHAVRDSLVDELYADLCRRRPWLRWAEHLPTFLAPIVNVVFEVPLRGLYRLWLTRTRRLRWFTGEFTQNTRTPAQNFLEAADRLVPSRRICPPAQIHTEAERKQAESAQRQTDLIQRLLLQALLRDLRRALRPNPLSVRRRRRRWPFVLLLTHVGDPDTPARKLYADYVNVVQSVPAPLLVFGALTGTKPPQDIERVEIVTPQIAEFLANAHRPLLVHLAQELDEAEAAAWLSSRPHPPIRPPGKRDYVVPVALGLVFPVTVAGGISLLHPKPGGCRPAPDSAETIGVTDGRQCHLGREGDALWELEELIARHNQAIDTDQPYRSVVFFGPLSVSSATAVPNSIQQLRGAVMAQIGLNRPGGQAAKVPIRVLIANSGDRFRYGRQVAEEIIRRAEREQIAAVIGIGQSRTESQEAVQVLSEAQIPVIGGSVTGDAMVNELDLSFYFQISPPNRRIAAVAAEFARKSRELTPGRKADSPLREAIVVYNPDPDDLFSQNLLEDFKAFYPKVFPVPQLEKVPQQTGRLAEEICTRLLQTKGFVFYAGRPPELRDLLNSMGQNNTCRNKVPADSGYLPMLASSAATAFLADRHTRTEDYPFLRLFYVSFYDPSPPRRPTDPRLAFAEQFTEHFKDLTPESDAAASFDALKVASAAIDATYVTHGGDQFQPIDVRASILNGNVRELAGATGIITLGMTPRYTANKAVYILYAGANGKHELRLGCGLLPDGTDPQTVTSAGDTFACPRQ